MVGPYDQAQMASWLERIRNDMSFGFFVFLQWICTDFQKNVPAWETFLPEIPLDFVITLKIMSLEGYWLMCSVEEIVN